MNFKLQKISCNSVRFKIIVGMCCILIPLSGYIIYSNLYATHVTQSEVSQSYDNMLTQYIGQLDINLNAVDMYLSTMATSNTDIQGMNLEPDNNKSFIYTANVSNKLSDDIIAYNLMDSIFVYDTVNGQFLYANSGSEAYEENTAMREEMIRQIRAKYSFDDSFQHGWITEQVGNQYYLLRMFRMDKVYVGAWVRIKKLLGQLDTDHLGGEGAYLYALRDGRPIGSTNPAVQKELTNTGKLTQGKETELSRQYLVVNEQSKETGLYLYAFISKHRILEQLPLLQKFTAFIVAFAIMLIPLSMLFLHRVIFRPIGHIVTGMKRVGNGDLDIRIKPLATSDEFELLNTTFNTMLDQIHDLKIDIYEERLGKQKAELTYLRHQVNPHFFLNSLNIIYRLAQNRQYEVIQQMSLSMLEYFRYVFTKHDDFVSLRDELQHVRNYLKIQKLRFPDKFICEIDADEFLMDAPIPPLTIQNFVENCVKYAITMDDTVKISIEIRYQKADGEERMVIWVRDTGNGFDPEVLRKLQAGEKIFDKRGEHMGIWIIRKMLTLLYDGKVKLEFSNGNPGAIVKLEIPTITQVPSTDNKS